MNPVIFVLFVVAVVNAISGGHDTVIKWHKWVLSLQHDNQHFCGATLISWDWAITSAYCVNLHPTGLTVRAGSTLKSSGGQVLNVEKAVVHPNYNSITHDSDIALIKFTEKADDTITYPEALPWYTTDVKEYSPTDIAGWGLNTTDGTYLETLQMAQFSTMSRENCQSAYPSTVINLNMFCGGWIGGNTNVSACDGDFGGAGLIYHRIEGIMSWGKSCGSNKYPTVFTRVANYMDWIKDVSNVTKNG